MQKRIALLAALSLAACQQESTPDAESVERISLEETGPRQPAAEISPDTSRSGWMVAANGQAILFGNPGDPPFLTLACDLSTEEPGFTIIRHAEALPGQSALFPFVGNGMRSRFLSDAVLARSGGESEWRWETRLPADDPQLDVFAGTRELTATLPGHGMLEIVGSRIPGQFLDWCRAGGETDTDDEDGDEASEDAEAED